MNYYNEFDPKAAAWLRELIAQKLIPNGTVDTRSITDVSPNDLSGFTQCHFFAGVAGWSLALQLAGWPSDRPVWTGSCPCQPFSDAGEGHGLNDPRHLWPEFFRLSRQRKPPVIIGEQVASKAALPWLDLVFTDLEGEGYACGASDLCAAGVGADHIRQRLYWVAYATGQRQPQSGQRRQDPRNHSADAFREADRLVDAVRRGDLPFLCRRHDGVSLQLARCAGAGFGNAIVPEVAAEFIQAFCEVTR